MSKQDLLQLLNVTEEGVINYREDFTLIDLLEFNASHDEDRTAVRYIDYSGYEDKIESISWKDFLIRIKAVAARIQQVSKRGDRVAILCRQSIEYVIAHMAAITAGNISVPLFEPSEIGHADRLDAVIKDSDPALILTSTHTAEEVRNFFRRYPAKERPRVLAVDAVPDDVGMLWWKPPTNVRDVAYLQYTSGSTRIPTGVQITHENMATNVLQIAEILDINDRGASVSWLPLFHDMGLISMFTPVASGGSTTLMSPSAFVRRPGRWLQALSDVSQGENFSHAWAAAPNFAYELVATRGAKDLHNVDLSKLILLNGSEPISVSTVRKFAEVFGSRGYSNKTLKPCFGLAEATLMVSSTRTDSELLINYFNREEMSQGRAVTVTEDDPTAMALAGCGSVTRFQDVLIVDPETKEELPDNHVGEIWCYGQNVAKGYWNKPAETEYAFHAQTSSRIPNSPHVTIAPEDAHFMRTGDLGFYHEGQLYITGRIKDIIIIAGRNHYAHDIEFTVQNASKAIRSGYSAAFTVPAHELARLSNDRENLEYESESDDITEQLVVVAERASGVGKIDFEEVKDKIRLAIATTHGITLRDLVLVSAGTIPRTSSGKIAHSATRAAYLDASILAHSKFR